MEDLIKKFSINLLQNEKGMIKEQDLRNFCESDEQYKSIIKKILKNFDAIGLSLVRTSFQNERYFVVTKPGKDASISPTMYGILSLLISTYNELGNNIPLNEIKKIFNTSWNDIELLIKENYLQIVERKKEKYLEITPLAKASFKDVIKNINLKDLLDF